MVRHPLIASIDQFVGAASGWGDRPALVDRQRTVTYRQLDHECHLWARLLADMGVPVGAHVGVQLPNSVDAALSLLGVVRAGYVWVGLPVGAPEAWRSRLAERTDVAVIIDRPPSDDIEHIDAAPPAAARATAPADPNRCVAISFTSGSSADPKAVMHSEHNLMLAAAAGARRGDGRGVVGMYLSLMSVNMQVLGPLQALAGGGRCVCLDRRDAPSVAAAVGEHGVTAMPMAAATAYDWLADEQLDARTLASLIEPVVGGSGADDALLAAYAERFGHRLTLGYGLTEAPTSVCREPRDRPRRPGTSGVAVDHLEVEIVDDHGRPLPAGEPGEITVRAAAHGPWAGLYRPMLGYWGDSAATAAALRDGALHTGDRGCVDADGFLTVIGRASSVIVRGGANVSVAAIEAALRAVPGVTDAVVVGRPDVRLGAVPVAVVTGPATADEISDQLRVVLDRAHQPARLIRVSSLGRDANGKVGREVLDRLIAADDGEPPDPV